MIATDRLDRIDVAALRARIAQDRAAGLKPFLVVGSAGTVDMGAIDDLRALSELCRAEKLWFHVDGAYGALGMLAPEIAPRLDGLQQADSVAFDFHKWGQVPYDAGFLLVRDGSKHRETFASPAAYLRRETRGLAAGTPWPCDLGPDLSRGFRALKTWFTLKAYGADKLGAMIERTCALARYLESRILAEPRLELLAPAQLNIVCFRYRGSDADALNADIVADIHESGIAAPSTTTIHGAAGDPRRHRQPPHRQLRHRCPDRRGAELRRGARRWPQLQPGAVGRRPLCADGATRHRGVFLRRPAARGNRIPAQLNFGRRQPGTRSGSLPSICNAACMATM